MRGQKLERATTKEAQVRYQLVAEADGMKMFKSVDAESYSGLDVPELR